jgi:hypothetical protein
MQPALTRYVDIARALLTLTHYANIADSRLFLFMSLEGSLNYLIEGDPFVGHRDPGNAWRESQWASILERPDP